MKDVNRVVLIGRLGADPEIRYTNGGKPVANLRIATSMEVRTPDGTKEHTEWHRCVAFGGWAEYVQEHLNKGSKVYLEGRNQTRKWTDNQGVDRYITEVVVNAIEAMGAVASAGAGLPQGGQQQRAPRKAPPLDEGLPPANQVPAMPRQAPPVTPRQQQPQQPQTQVRQTPAGTQYEEVDW